MKLGFCTDRNGLELAARAGCDYVEMSFTAVTRMEGADYAGLLQTVEDSGLAVEAMNGFIPGDFSLCSQDGGKGVMDFVLKGMDRARRLGVQVVVFGSGAARRIPEGMEKEAAWDRLAAFLREAGAVAQKAGIRIAVEPLCYAECNAVNTLLEGWSLAKRCDREPVKALADLYHMGQNGEDMEDLHKVGPDLIHCHIGRPGSRKYPMPEDGYDYTAFFRALEAIQYAGRLSIEAGCPGSPEDLIPSIAYLRSLAR